jgi:hypothetical protein
MLEIIKICKKHGKLTEELVYRSKDKKYSSGYALKCKKCCYEAIRKRPCKVHGVISDDDRVESGGCRVCAHNKMKKMNDRRNNNRPEFNEKMRLKKEANPEWWKQVKKQEYDRLVDRVGNDALCESQKAKKFDLTIEEFRKMFEEQKNLCAICNQPETRIFTGRGANAGRMKVAKLCVDHCHSSGKIRGLLCHDCNTSIGKMKDDVDRLQSAINYLNKHKD